MKKERIYALRGTHCNNILGVYMNLTEAKKSLQEVEDSDKMLGIYEPNTYEIASYHLQFNAIISDI